MLVAAAALVAFGEAVLPTEGLAGFLERVLLWLAFPVVLFVCGFLSREERVAIRRFTEPGAIRSNLADLRSAPRGSEGDDLDADSHGGAVPETFEQASRDTDRPF